MKTKITLFSIILILAIAATELYSQDAPHSVGPAPIVNDNTPFVHQNDAAIGTRYFVQVSSSPTFTLGKAFMENCMVTNIGSPVPITFPGGLLYRNGVLYSYNQSAPYQLWSLDTVSGVTTLLFNMTGVPQTNLTGMMWDGTNVYGLSTSITQSQIFIINMTTGVCTPIGTPSAVCAGGIMLLGRMGAASTLYAIDIVADNSYRVNKTTGVLTLNGPLGVNINFGQDGSVDPNDNTIYVACYSTGPELRKFDTATGSFGPVLCTYSAQITGLACVASGTPPVNPQTTICRTGINVPIINHGTTFDSVQVLLGSSCNVLDVNVRITNVTHTWDSDLTFYLRKGNVGAKIINKVGGSGDNFVNTVLNDSATIPIASGTAPFTGSYIPFSPLAPFNFTGGLGDGYWKLVITDTASGDSGTLTGWCLIITYSCISGGIQTIEIPNYYFLEQNYPNPFNPVTNIKFGIPETGNVRLVVFDILGREVTTLMNEHKNPGTYEVKFDASQLASGIYFYSLQTERVTETKRMLLVK
jgi:hypothetical protein